MKENTGQASNVTLILTTVIRAQYQTPQNKRTTKKTNLTKLRIARRLLLSTAEFITISRTLKTQNKHFKGSYLVASKTVHRFSVNKASNLFRKLHLTTHTFRNYKPTQVGVIPYHHIDQGTLHCLVTNSTSAVVNRQKTKMSETNSWLPNR